MELFIGFIIFIVLLIAVIRFFGMCSDIGAIRLMLRDFTKYYYSMQEYKNKTVVNT